MQAPAGRYSVQIDRSTAMRLGASLVLALLLWGWVTISRDPETTRSFTNVPISVGQLPNDLQVVGELPNVAVRITGPRSEVSDLISSDVTASLDLGGIDAEGDYTASIDVQTPRGIWSSEASPSRLPVRVERSVTQQFVLETAISGNVDSTRQVSASIVDVSEVNVVGPSSSVGRVAKVIAPITIENQTRDFTSAVTPVAVDADGNPIPEVSLSPNIVTVHVDIQARGKRVAVITQLEGEPAQGYEVVDRTINPATVLVDGPQEAIASLISVSTEPIDIDGASETVSRRVAISGLPEGVHVIEPSDASVDVVVQIRQIGVRQPLPAQAVQVVGLEPGLTADVEPASIAVTVIASEEMLGSLTTNDLTIQVNVAGLGPGTYQLRPIVALPSNVTWVDADATTVRVTISDGRSSPVASPAASPVASPSSVT
jgi:YbbR domain-containing protein